MNLDDLQKRLDELENKLRIISEKHYSEAKSFIDERNEIEDILRLYKHTPVKSIGQIYSVEFKVISNKRTDKIKNIIDDLGE